MNSIRFTINPRKVLRITINDGRCDDARDAVGVDLVRAFDDRGNGGASGVYGDVGLLIVLDGAVPAR